MDYTCGLWSNLTAGPCNIPRTAQSQQDDVSSVTSWVSLSSNLRFINIFTIMFQFVWREPRFMENASWLTPWRNATTQPARTASPKVARSAPRSLSMRTTSYMTTCARALGPTRKSGWALMICRQRVSGSTRLGPPHGIRIGTHPLRAIAPWIAQCCLGRLAGSGWMRTVRKRGRLCASLT